VLDASGLANGVTLLPKTGNTRLFTVYTIGNLTAKGVTFADVFFQSSVSDLSSGALLIMGSATFDGCTFRNNTANCLNGVAAGAIRANDGTYVFRNCVFRDNSVTGGTYAYGGAIFASSSVAKWTFIGTSFINNRAMVSLYRVTKSPHSMDLHLGLTCPLLKCTMYS
jgi:hypothetical protein